MGDRANILVKDNSEDTGVYLYTHWGGTDLPLRLQQALRKGERWNDSQYLTRIIFCAMVDREDWDGTTGYGISSIVGDGDDRILEVNVKKAIVSVGGKTWTFDEFARLGSRQIQGIWGYN